MTSWFETTPRGSSLRWAVALAVVGAAFLLGCVVSAHTSVVTHPAHDCDSPCAVWLPDNTQEDEFRIDYGWSGDTPVVDVYTPAQHMDKMATLRRRFCRSHTHTLRAYMECLRNV